MGNPVRLPGQASPSRNSAPVNESLILCYHTKLGLPCALLVPPEESYQRLGSLPPLRSMSLSPRQSACFGCAACQARSFVSWESYSPSSQNNPLKNMSETKRLGHHGSPFNQSELPCGAIWPKDLATLDTRLTQWLNWRDGKSDAPAWHPASKNFVSRNSARKNTK